MPPDSKKVHIDDTLLVEYLNGLQREVFPICRDGNCFFRCIAFELLGTQDSHMTIRDIVVKHISFNQPLFTAYHMPQGTAATIEDHLQTMSKSSTWATELEIKATATLFQVPVYYCILNDTTENYQWEVIYPLKLRSIQLPSEFVEAVSKINHFELFYTRNLHYDAVISSETGKVSVVTPKLIDIEEYVMLD